MKINRAELSELSLNDLFALSSLIEMNERLMIENKGYTEEDIEIIREVINDAIDLTMEKIFPLSDQRIDIISKDGEIEQL